MSLVRLVYYSAVISGWAAFLGWMLAECLLMRGDGDRYGLFGTIIAGAFVGAAIGAGLNLVAGMTNARFKALMMRVPTGLIGGGIGGALGILVGQFVYSIGLPRALGFMLLGLGVGAVEGLYEKSKSKIRNGTIGGLVGGLLGGFLFDPISSLLSSGTGIASRATAFVILGIAIGAMIALVQVVLREACLTVMDGYGVGRQLILSRAETLLGRGDHLSLPFLGPSNSDLDSEHARISRQPDGAFLLEDISSKLGVAVRRAGETAYQPVRGSHSLRNDDVIRLGTNIVRFNERKKDHGPRDETSVPVTIATANQHAPPPPPPPPPGKQKPNSPASRHTPAPPTTLKTLPAVSPTGDPKPSRPAPAKALLPAPPPPPPGKKKN